jgi:hypothetical protein
MKKALMILPAFLLLSGCFDHEAEWKADCQKEYPSDQAKADGCFAKRQAEAAKDAWVWGKTGGR